MRDVAAKALEGTQAPLDLSVISLIGQADIVVQGVMLLLLAASVVCWTIVFEKSRKLKKERVNTDDFDLSSNDKHYSLLLDHIGRLSPGRNYFNPIESLNIRTG